MLSLKTLHIIFMVSWFAGLFYLPRLFVHHAMSCDKQTRQRLSIMEKKLFWFITPWAVLTIVFGTWMSFYLYSWQVFTTMYWLHIKIFLVFVLVLYNIWCGFLQVEFRGETNPHSHRWFRWFNEFPLLLLIVIVFLAEFQNALFY
ncbi:MAG: TIGR00701 family protein [Gammaproteobacteria bacterium]|nr:MAG: TIGR00701 family protein [Gammaproteobacteria bacterium]